MKLLVMVVADEGHVGRLLQLKLEEGGCSVIAACSGRGDVELKASAYEIDLAVVDEAIAQTDVISALGHERVPYVIYHRAASSGERHETPMASFVRAQAESEIQFDPAVLTAGEGGCAGSITGSGAVQALYEHLAAALDR